MKAHHSSAVFRRPVGVWAELFCYCCCCFVFLFLYKGKVQVLLPLKLDIYFVKLLKYGDWGEWCLITLHSPVCVVFIPSVLLTQRKCKNHSFELKAQSNELHTWKCSLQITPKILRNELCFKASINYECSSVLLDPGKKTWLKRKWELEGCGRL